MDVDVFEDYHDGRREPPPGMLCTEAGTLSDGLIRCLGDALEEHRSAVAYRLNIVSDLPMSMALSKWCQHPGSTVFVLRSVLIDIGRRDLAQKLVLDMMMIHVYFVVEEVDTNTNHIRRNFQQVQTHSDASLASALENRLTCDLDRYEIIGPESWISWSTPAIELKGRQLTLRHHLSPKTDKDGYGCNNNTDYHNQPKCQVPKTNFYQPPPANAFPELQVGGPYTIAGNRDNEFHKRNSLKRAQTMPADLNIPPEGMYHEIQPQKCLEISPAPSASHESQQINLTERNTFVAVSPVSTTMPLSTYGNAASQPATLSSTISFNNDTFTMDESTALKVPVTKRPIRLMGVPLANFDNISAASTDIENEDVVAHNVSHHNHLPIKEHNIDGYESVTMIKTVAAQQDVVNTTVPDLSIFEHGFYGNSPIPQSPVQANLNQLSEPATPRNNLNYVHTPLSPVENISRDDLVDGNSYPRPTVAYARSTPEDARSMVEAEKSTPEDARSMHEAARSMREAGGPTLGFQELAYDRGEPMDFVTEDGVAVTNDTDGWSNPSSTTISIPESDDRILSGEDILSTTTHIAGPVSHLKVINGKFMAQSEQQAKLAQYNRSMSYHPLQREEEVLDRHVSKCTSLESLEQSPPMKQSPFVHTPPPPILNSPDKPPNYLDVSSMRYEESQPWHHHHHSHAHQPSDFHQHSTDGHLWHQYPHQQSHAYQQSHLDQHIPVSQSHAQIITQTVHPQHNHYSRMPGIEQHMPPRSMPVHANCAVRASSPGQLRHSEMQTTPVFARRHNGQHNHFGYAASSVSEPAAMRYTPTTITTTTGTSGDVAYVNDERAGLYLTPIDRPLPPPRRARSPIQDNGGYDTISTTRQVRQVPNRVPPPTPRRPQMHLDDQLSKIQGWCPFETDSTIEKTMNGYIDAHGYYIVWRSNLKRRFMISVSHKNSLHHFRIEQMRLDSHSDRVVYYLHKNGFSCESLLDLVNHYIKYGVKRTLTDLPRGVGEKAYACEHIQLRRPLIVKVYRKQVR